MNHNQNSFFWLNNIVGISNGPLSEDHLELSGSMKGPQGRTLYCLNTKDNFMFSNIVFVTPQVVTSRTSEDILKAIESHLLDFWFLKNFNGRDLVADLKATTLKKIAEKLKTDKFNELVLSLQQRFPQLTDDLKGRVSNFDWYHDYSDDASVHRRALLSKSDILDSLEKINASEYFELYAKLYYNRDKY